MRRHPAGGRGRRSPPRRCRGAPRRRPGRRRPRRLQRVGAHRGGDRCLRVQLPSAARGPQGRCRRRGRLPGRGQTQRPDAVHHLGHGRRPRRSGLAGRRHRRSQWRRRARRGARDPPAGASGFVHRLHRGRLADRAIRGPRPQEVRPRARLERRHDRGSRRGPRPGRGPVRHRSHRKHRTVLHLRPADLRRRDRRRRVHRQAGGASRSADPRATGRLGHPGRAIVSDRAARKDENPHLADARAFFELPLPGRDAALGNPGGAARLGEIGADTPFVAGQSAS